MNPWAHQRFSKFLDTGVVKPFFVNKRKRCLDDFFFCFRFHVGNYNRPVNYCQALFENFLYHPLAWVSSNKPMAE